MIVDQNGKKIELESENPCTKCGRPPDQRIPSGGFGQEIHLMCPCGNDFGKRLKWRNPTW